MTQAPDQRISLTDRDARTRATRGRGAGVVGRNVQTVVSMQNHRIVAHEVTNVAYRAQLTALTTAARDTIGHHEMTEFAIRGHFTGEETLDRGEGHIRTLVPNPLTTEINKG